MKVIVAIFSSDVFVIVSCDVIVYLFSLSFHFDSKLI